MRSILIMIAFIAVFEGVMSLPNQNSADDGSQHRIHDDHNHARSRRNLIQFYKMIDCATSNDPLKYNHYGCYCGLGGEGTPVDGLDRCCQTHDACYRRINRDKLCTFPWNIYTKVYKREGCAECAPSNDKCQLAICRCDSDAVKCFARNKIDPQYENYPQSKCN
nr:basic phospholipase A2 homolog 1-like [Pocillopora verrucosa]